MVENGKCQIDPTAIVDNGAVIGYGTRIWHWTHIMRAVIGLDCVIGQGVFIGNNVVIGNRCKIQNGAQLFDGVILGDNVFVGPCVCFTNVKHPTARYRSEYQRTLVEYGVVIGANATIVCGVKLGAECVIGAGAVVTKDVESGTTVVGNPARKLSNCST